MSGTLQTKDGVILLFFYSVDVGHNKMSGTMTFWSCFIVYFCRIVFLNSVDGGHNKMKKFILAKLVVCMSKCKF